MGRWIFMQHVVHSSSYGYIMPLWRIHLWVLSPSCLHYMVRVIFLQLFIVPYNICMLLPFLQRGKFLFRLHGLFLANYYDGYIHLMYDPGPVYGCFLCAQLTYSAIYYLLVGVMTYTTSHLSGDNLPWYFLKL